MPARAASIVAFNASMLVCPEIAPIVSANCPTWSAASRRRPTSAAPCATVSPMPWSALAAAPDAPRTDDPLALVERDHDLGEPLRGAGFRAAPEAACTGHHRGAAPQRLAGEAVVGIGARADPRVRCRRGDQLHLVPRL